MTSTYSPSLRINLQGTGDNSGTWGAIANVDFTLIEQAIAGYTTYPVTGGTVTLTASNGASDQARNAMINVTGVLTSAATIVVPSQTKNWVFFNGTSGAFGLTISASGGTGTAITQGKNAWLYCDGTNVSKLLTLDVMDGSISVAGGGTGASTAAGARTSLGAAASGANTDITSLGATPVAMTAAALNMAKGAAIPSASTCNIFTNTDGNLVHITGNTGISNFGTATQAGEWRVVIFDSTPTLSNNSNIILPGATSYTASAGDLFLFVADTTTVTRVAGYALASGQALVASSPSSGSFVSVKRQVFTSSGTYTPSTGMLYCDVEVQAAGGGSGGCAATGGNQNASGGGGGGGYSKKAISAASIGGSQAVTIGAPGTGGSAGASAGGTGSSTSFGAILSATAGQGGAGAAAASFVNAGGPGGAGSSGDFSISGGRGSPGLFAGNINVAGQFLMLGGQGGGSHMGAPTNGVPSLTQSVSVTGNSYGAGAAGASNFNSQAAVAGAAGGPGIVIVTEYCSQ